MHSTASFIMGMINLLLVITAFERYGQWDGIGVLAWSGGPLIIRSKTHSPCSSSSSSSRLTFTNDTDQISSKSPTTLENLLYNSQHGKGQYLELCHRRFRRPNRVHSPSAVLCSTVRSVCLSVCLVPDRKYDKMLTDYCHHTIGQCSSKIILHSFSSLPSSLLCSNPSASANLDLEKDTKKKKYISKISLSLSLSLSPHGSLSASLSHAGGVYFWKETVPDLVF